MLLLYETASGYGLFKVLDEKKLEKVDDIEKYFENAENNKILKLVDFYKFKDATEALLSVKLNLEGKLSKKLKHFLQRFFEKHNLHDDLAIADTKLGGLIKETLNISCINNSSIQELFRGIRLQSDTFFNDISTTDQSNMTLSLAHSLSRYRLKFSPDKIDTMVIQAITLMDDLEKELNNYIMRCKEWYGWHFPELSKIISDGKDYVNVILKMGTRDQAKNCNFDGIVSDEFIEQIKVAAEISMGTEISTDDIDNISDLCFQIKEMIEYKDQLNDYINNRMQIIAPNLSILVGEYVGARLIAKAGSLMNLAKQPASTVQILGAEKALFRALKTKRNTPKYGIIYHASLVTKAPNHLKGKITRSLAAKAALSIRCDALSDDVAIDSSINNKNLLEAKLNFLETNKINSISKGSKNLQNFKKYEFKSNIIYNPVNDSTNDMFKKMDVSSTSKKIKTNDEPNNTISDKNQSQENTFMKPGKKRLIEDKDQPNPIDEANTLTKKQKIKNFITSNASC